ncbi:MAG: hypothetical protein B7C24_06130, partial [Bacteroidetes bacterium 4572_77]
MLTYLSTDNCGFFWSLIIFVGVSATAYGQQDTTFLQERDSIYSQNNKSFQDNVPALDTLRPLLDTTKKDTVFYQEEPLKSSVLDTKVEYPAQDSIRFDLRDKKVYMYNKAQVKYGSLDLQGDYMEIDFNKKEIFSQGVEDTAGVIVGKPIFKESDDEFGSEKMRYNFESKKGLITGVKTEESGGFLHGEVIKKMPDNTAYIKNGRFTTCSLDHPHFAFRFRRSKVIPGDKIVTGPAFFEIAHVPTPIMLPFGLFPNQQGKQSGIIVPEFGEVDKMGYYLKDGGYYWAISDYLDFTLKGSVYSRGSWAINALSKYKKRYKYSGNL